MCIKDCTAKNIKLVLIEKDKCFTNNTYAYKL